MYKTTDEKSTRSRTPQIDACGDEGKKGRAHDSLPRAGDGRRPSCEGEETWRRSQPHSARRSSVIHAAPQETAVRTARRQPQREERGAPKRTAQSATALSSQIGIMPHSRLQWMVPRTPTVRHAADRPLPLQKKQKAEPGTPSLPSHRRGEHKQSSLRTIGAYSREEKRRKRGHVSSTAGRRTLNRTR
ncbi:hypothetical protein TcCL_NonESM10016 [Trypanosoma cruzi]|nr:hypothetical protein TcCL_NonESM10016 [Trypanosoma cruzi]